MNTPTEISQELFERIEAYLKGILPPEELERFERDLASQERLRQELELQKELLLTIEAGALREHLREIARRYPTHSNPSRKTKGLWYAAAAGIAALFGLGVWFLAQPDTKEALFAELVQYDPGLPVPMSTTNKYHFYDAMVDYKNELPQKAIEKWSSLLQETPDNDTLNYYLGAAHFKLKQYDEALAYFRTVEALPPNTFKEKSQWYSALSFFQNGNYAAIDSLQHTALPGNRERITALSEALSELE